MAKLGIRKYGDSVLRKKSETIHKIDREIKDLAGSMFETMYAAFGVGLAAPQVGTLIRMCVINVDPGRKFPFVMVNPEIISCEGIVSGKEGCLSLPGVFADVERSLNIVAEYTDLDGINKKIKAEGLLARAVQHEIDHLDAKIFIDYLPAWKRKNVEREIKRKKKKGSW
ncbi:MAG: peptide deformylase [Endomicrobium sp.]|jgi:peptide deformylase|nr:peptide deformylase [Endomicrobium sp.]